MEDRADSELGLKDYAGILRRRAKPFLLIAAPIITIAAALAFRLPPVYESTGVLLVEQSPISQELVRSSIGSLPDERVRRITQRVLVDENLAGIVEVRQPYPELGTGPEAVRELRRQVVTAAEDPEMLASLVASNPNLIAFRVGVRHADPALANAIADDLVALYLEENHEARQELAADTLTFLEQQAARLEERIANQEVALADFRRENAGRLPELSNMNMQMLDRTERDLQAAEAEIRAIRERISLAESDLAQLSPYAPVFDENGNQILSAVDRLKLLQRRYAQDSANYGQDHPDLIRLRAEIDSLAAQTGLPGIDHSILESTLAGRIRELDNLRELGRADEHPDVRRAELAIENLRAALAEAPRTATRTAPATPPDNPQYIRTEVQLRAARSELAAAIERRDNLRERLGSVEERLTATPEVAREYARLSRGYDQLLEQYNELLNNIQDASMSASLETAQPGELFSVLRAPNMPRSPSQPNRIAILLLGFVIAFMGGAAAVAAAELVDSTVRSPRDVVSLLEIPPLVMIPFIENDTDARRRRWGRAAAAAGVLLWVGVTAFFFMTPAGQ